MTLTTDAERFVVSNNVNFEGTLEEDILIHIEQDLHIDDIVSILFLMVEDYSTAFQEIFNLYKKHKTENYCILKEFVRNHPERWKTKLLEALCVTQNRRIIKKLGLKLPDLKVIYLPETPNISYSINVIAKCLYFVCEALTEEETELLIKNVKLDKILDNETLNNVNYLELHLLHWMSIDYIFLGIDGRMDLRNLLKHLKPFDSLELLCMDLQRFQSNQNVSDTTSITTSNGIQALPKYNTSTGPGNKEEDVKRIKKGLCIIISEILFSGEYETRDGSQVDAENLKETFEGFGFKVVLYENLDEKKMLETLSSIPDKFGSDYDCLFVCLLSHGAEGSVITTDDKRVPLKTIEQKICRAELKDVVKIVVVQACQGKTTGYKTDADLTADGPYEQSNVSSVSRYKNFCMFVSTMQGFISVRHKLEGSWFIQEFCNTLKNGNGELTFFQAYRRITQCVERKKGKLRSVDPVAQIPELLVCRLLTDVQFPKFHPRS